ncbi:hypothetical protein Ae717Ps2_2063c [Pseudonocardia sp. Ae717_Ps2]|uniref:VOC family protein n=1 Tax=Pseudonocardia sp. Ae717_Ps2 TaxID=1885573 RepID=UPI0009633968|nr:VOC family protein [Pseudonocardia sp. Ae717_Ps2]OLM31168.1 hypothetical protein Ae717Ps2_2063c [Pseudonocardia sp. Ae717_Ps2]
MTRFDFGQPVGGMIQVAYTVPDIDTAMKAWTERVGIGPWFVRGPFTPPGARYRDLPTAPTLTLARAFNGHTMIELVRQHDDGPSVYRDVIEGQGRGHGFHHIAIGVHDFDAAVTGHRRAGAEVVFTDTLPTGARVAYVDTTDILPGMVEIVEMNEAQERVYTDIHLASVGWDGTDPVREG